MFARIEKWGDSQGIRLPEELLKAARLRTGQEVWIWIDNDRILVEPATELTEPPTKIRGKYSLRTLVARMPREYQAKEIDWGITMGKEIL